MGNSCYMNTFQDPSHEPTAQRIPVKSYKVHLENRINRRKLKFDTDIIFQNTNTVEQGKIRKRKAKSSQNSFIYVVPTMSKCFLSDDDNTYSGNNQKLSKKSMPVYLHQRADDNDDI